MDGMTENVASSATGNAGLTLGIIGTALGVLAGGNGILGNGILGGAAASQKYVTKDEFEMGQQLAQKDSTIALLQSEKTTDAKLVDVYKASAQQDKEIRALIAAEKEKQMEINAAQSAWNATAGAKMSSMATSIANQAATLASITTSVVPQNKVCETCSCCGCNS